MSEELVRRVLAEMPPEPASPACDGCGRPLGDFSAFVTYSAFGRVLKQHLCEECIAADPPADRACLP